jgi:hypothetical protein
MHYFKSILQLILASRRFKDHSTRNWFNLGDRSVECLSKLLNLTESTSLVRHSLCCGVLASSRHSVANVILRERKSVDESGTDQAGYRSNASDPLPHSLVVNTGLHTTRRNATIFAFICYICFKQTTITWLYSIHWLPFLMEVHSVLCGVRTEALYNVA